VPYLLVDRVPSTAFISDIGTPLSVVPSTTDLPAVCSAPTFAARNAFVLTNLPVSSNDAPDERSNRSTPGHFSFGSSAAHQYPCTENDWELFFIGVIVLCAASPGEFYQGEGGQPVTTGARMLVESSVNA
jgi:hypothetical protein